MNLKHGVFTSEFLLGLVAVVVPSVVQYLQGNENPWVAMAGMALAAAYGSYRTSLKSAHLDAATAPAAPAPEVAK